MSRFTATERLRRLLAVIPWVAAQGTVPLDDVAARFEYPRDRLEEDLREIVPMVGVHPFTPDTLIEVDIDHEVVSIRYADWFTRPLRLDSAQAVALLAAGQSMLAVAGDDDGDTPDPLLRGLTKLGAAMDASGDGVPLVVRLGDVSGEVLAVLRRAVDEHRVVAIEYYVYSRDEWTERTIEPHRFFADEGQWYVAGHCRAADDGRVFRVDRIARATLGDETFEPPDQPAPPVVFDAGDAPRVELELSPPAAWVADQYPHDRATVADDGSTTVLLAVTGVSWLERLLLRLGSDVRVIDPGPFADDLVAGAADRVLDRYER